MTREVLAHLYLASHLMSLLAPGQEGLCAEENPDPEDQKSIPNAPVPFFIHCLRMVRQKPTRRVGQFSLSVSPVILGKGKGKRRKWLPGKGT